MSPELGSTLAFPKREKRQAGERKGAQLCRGLCVFRLGLPLCRRGIVSACRGLRLDGLWKKQRPPFTVPRPSLGSSEQPRLPAHPERPHQAPPLWWAPLAGGTAPVVAKCTASVATPLLRLEFTPSLGTAGENNGTHMPRFHSLVTLSHRTQQTRNNLDSKEFHTLLEL